ncbi:MAG: Catabolite control protein A [Tenericutes bacterium ADurb.Bin087]|nr:MAG: Catabolite control protein A [Tenericutes bacterium ADurb.Bin087]
MATLKDIAKATGFSVITVSRVINTPHLVKEKTRAIIEAEIARQNFKPNVLARALVQNRTNIIYVYIPADIDAINPFFLHVVSGIGEVLGEQGFSLLLKRTWYNNEDCDGCIFMGLSSEDEAKVFALSQIKPVCVFGFVEGVSSVDIDNYQGLFLMTNHVLSRGYRKLTYLGIDEPRRFIRQREKGFNDAVMNKSGELTLNYLYAKNNENAAYKVVGNSLKQDKMPEVIVCASDDMAIGAIRAIKEKGLEVPRDVAVTGFDGLGTQEVAHPRLTTIHQPIYEAGKALAHRIIALIESKNNLPTNHTFIETTILHRESL